MNKIGFYGMSHLGLCYSVAAAEKGYNVVCYDIDDAVIENLNQASLPIEEPKLQELLLKNNKNLFYTSNLEELNKCDIVFYSYDIVTNEKDLSDLKNITENISILLNSIDNENPIVILSQVPPGYTRKNNFGRKNVYYQVETLIFGRAVERALYPERFIVGCSSSEDILENNYKIFLNSFNCPIIKMKYESAELAKIAINCYLASSVTITNTLAEISETIGANWYEIIPSLKLDKRIGNYAYISPGLGISGGNIERDLETVKNIGKKLNTNTEAIDSITKLSQYSKNWLYRKVSLNLKDIKNGKVCVLGLSYKENTDSIKNSPAIELINKIKKANIAAYDPMVPISEVPGVTRMDTIYGAANNADILVIATPWPIFKEIDLKKIKNMMNGSIIIDPYNIIDSRLLKLNGFKFYSLGLN